MTIELQASITRWRNASNDLIEAINTGNAPVSDHGIAIAWKEFADELQAIQAAQAPQGEPRPTATAGTLQDQRDKLLAALEPFASIGAWLFARPEVPDEEVMVVIEGINGSRGAFTRGQFKASHIAFADASREQASSPATAGGLPPSPALDPRLLAIAGLVNGYHNGGTRLMSVEVLHEIAQVLGKLMGREAVPLSSPPDSPELIASSPYPAIACGESDLNPRTERLIVAAREATGHVVDSPECGGRLVLLPQAYRCVECGRWFHRACLLKHFACHTHTAHPEQEPA